MFQITKGLGSKPNYVSYLNQHIDGEILMIILMKSIATGPFTWFSIYLDLAFKTYQEAYKVFCIIRRSLKVSTPYRKMLCCCPLSFHSLHKEYPGTMIRLLTTKNSLHFDLGFPTEASSNYIGCANHSQVFF